MKKLALIISHLLFIFIPNIIFAQQSNLTSIDASKMRIVEKPEFTVEKKNTIEVASGYLKKALKSHSIAEDGFPLARSSFHFSDNELKQMDDIDSVKIGLKREQEKATKIFFTEHIMFKNYSPSVLQKHILRITDRINVAIDAYPNFQQLNSFSFDNYRNYLIRIASYELIEKQIQIKNPEGTANLFSFKNLVPKNIFEIVAALSLLLNLIIFGYLFKS